MSRSWHSPRQRGSASGPTSQRTTSSRPISHPEDAQPNESVDKRQRFPPAVNIAAAPAQQPPRRGSRRNTQFVTRGSVGYMRQTGGEATPPSNPAQPISNTKWRLRSSVSTPSLTLPSDPPPPKRRKLERPPLVETKRGPLTGKVIPTSTSSASPVSSETLVGEHRVKKERSISPELSSTEHQHITAGTKRYAPLPPECMKSQPNFKAARSAWAKKVQEELKRRGLKVVRTFIREDGMAIDWETTADTSPLATVEPTVLPDRATVSDDSTQPVDLAMPSLAHASGDLDQQGENRRSPSVVEIAFPTTLVGGDIRGSNEEPSSSVIVGQMSDPSSGPHRKGDSQHSIAVREDPITPVTIARLRPPPLDTTYISSSDRSRLQQTTTNVPSRTAPPSGQTRKQPTSPKTPVSPSQQHITAPRHSQPLPSPSQRAVDTLHHILHLKRQIGHRSSESPKPPAVSSSPSPLRKLHPVPKTRSGSPSRRSPGSFADTVAAAINEGTRLDRQQGPSSPSVQSTPLRVYKKRSSSLVTPIRNNESDAAPGIAEEHQAPRSPSDRHSTPPIAVLGLGESSSESQRATPSAIGDEYDELELSYPPSPSPPPPETLPDSLPVSTVPTDPARPEEPVKQAPQLSQSGPMPPTLDEQTAMHSSALRYLEHYFQTFDKDRRALAEVYAPDATFSCSSRRMRAQGRDNILDALQALGPGVLCSGNVEFDVTYLGPGIGVLLVALGTMCRTGVSKTGEVGYAMSFMLRPGGLDRERLDGLRPFVAAVHQVVLREEG